MAIHAGDIPARRLEALDLVGVVRQRGRAIDGDGVVVEQHDQVLQAQVTGQRNGFLADAFHEAAVACDHIGLVVDKIIAKARIEMALGHRHADRIGKALAQRAGGRLDARRVAVFGVARRFRSQLAEVLDLVERDFRIAGQIEQGIEQHRAMAG